MAAVEQDETMGSMTRTEEARLDATRFRTRFRLLPLIHFGVDSLIWLIALPLTTLLRYDFDASQLSVSGLGTSWAVAIAGQAFWGLSSGLYRRRWRYGGFEE